MSHYTIVASHHCRSSISSYSSKLFLIKLSIIHKMTYVLPIHCWLCSYDKFYTTWVNYLVTSVDTNGWFVVSLVFFKPLNSGWVIFFRLTEVLYSNTLVRLRVGLNSCKTIFIVKDKQSSLLPNSIHTFIVNLIRPQGVMQDHDAVCTRALRLNKWFIALKFLGLKGGSSEPSKPPSGYAPGGCIGISFYAA